MKTQVFERFESCPWHGFEPFEECGDDENIYDESKPLCYNQAVKALCKFEILHLCYYGPVKLEDKEYCTTCEFYPED